MNIRELLTEADINNIDINKKLDRAIAMDEVDTIAFGLETDDGMIVKVYVHKDKAEKFEELISQKLGEVDSIDDALNSIGQADPDMIIDVEWPDTDKAQSKDDNFDSPFDEPDDGSDVLNKQVYDNPAEDDDPKDAKIKQESSYGKRFQDRLTETQLNESIDKNQLKEIFSKIIMIVDRNFPNPNSNDPSARLVNDTANFTNFFNRIQSSALSKLNPVSSLLSNLNSKLDDIVSSFERKLDSTSIPGVNESVELKNDKVIKNINWTMSKEEEDNISISSSKYTFNLTVEEVESILKTISTKRVKIINTSSGDITVIPAAGKAGVMIKVDGLKSYLEITAAEISELADLIL